MGAKLGTVFKPFGQRGRVTKQALAKGRSKTILRLTVKASYRPINGGRLGYQALNTPSNIQKNMAKMGKPKTNQEAFALP